MGIATIVYEQYLAAKGPKRRIWSFVRRALIKLFSDPTCSLSIHGRRLKLPLSHPLPDYLNQFPFQDRLPQRLSGYIHKKYGHLSCIDVGANIGDTIAAFYQRDTDTFLGIEPNPTFNRLLADNWGWNRNVTVVPEACSSSSGDGPSVIEEKNGTASILQTEEVVTRSKRPLDAIVNDHPSAMSPNVIKIDTDGHDFEVIAGSEEVLSRNLPAVLFECVACDNTTYVEDCLRTLNSLQRIGYKRFLLYDNFGNLMGRYSLFDLWPFRNLLFCQLTGGHLYYFDILVMRDEDVCEFFKTEVDYFVGRMSNKSLQRTAVAAADLER